MKSLVQNNLDSYVKAEATGEKTFRRHVYLDKLLDNQSSYYHLMDYELLDLLADRYNKKELLFYTTEIKKGQEKICLLPQEFKDDFLKLGFLSEEDLRLKSDPNELVHKKYEEYQE